jgi:hypothetical protein
VYYTIGVIEVNVFTRKKISLRVRIYFVARLRRERLITWGRCVNIYMD